MRKDSLACLAILASLLSASVGSASEPVVAALHYSRAEPRGSAIPTAIAVSHSRVVVVGVFHGTVDFDPGPRERTLTSARNSGFIAWYSRSGKLRKVQGLLGFTVEPADVDVDAEGHVVIVGSFVLSADFDPGSGATELSTDGPAREGFVVKLDRRGRLLWARQFGPRDSSAASVATSSSGDVWVAARSLRPGAILRFDSTGELLSETGLPGEAVAIERAEGDAVLLAGRFSGAVDFAPDVAGGELLAVGHTDAFVAKLDRAGELLWAVSAGGGGPDIATGLAVDRDGTASVAGYFQVEADFDPSPTSTVRLEGAYRTPYLWQLSGEGTFAGAWRPTGHVHDEIGGLRIAAERRGRLVIGGSFRKSLELGSGGGTTVLESFGPSGGFDGLVGIFGRSARLRWAGAVGGYYSDGVRAVAVSGRNVYLTGYFGNGADLDPTSGETTTSVRGRQDMFLVRLIDRSR